MKKNSVSIYILIILGLFSIIFMTALTGCTSSGKSRKTPVLQEEAENKARQEALEKQKLNEQLISKSKKLLRTGKIDSLREAVEIIVNNNLQSSTRGKEILYLAKSIFEILYQKTNNRALIEYFEKLDTSSYKGKYFDAVEKIKNGMLSDMPKTNPEKNDFFGNILAGLSLFPKAKEKQNEILGYIDRALSIESESIIPVYIRALLFKRIGDIKKETASLRNAIKIDSGLFPAKILLAKEILGSKEAISLLKEVQQEIQPEAEIYYLLSKAYLSTNEIQKASSQIARAIVMEPANVKYLLLRANILEREKKWDRAIRVYQLILKRNPKIKEALLGLGRSIYYGKHDLKSTITVLSNAEKLFSNDADFPELKGKILLEESRENEGLKALNHALELEPDRISTLRLLLKNATKKKQWIQGSVYLSKIVKSGAPLTEDDCFMAYSIHMNINDPSSALPYAKKLYNAGTKEIYTYYYAKTLLTSGKIKEAEKIIDNSLNSIRDSRIKSRLYYLKGIIAEKNDPEKALNFLRHSIFEFSENVDTMIEIARLYIRDNEFRKASLYLKQAVKLRPHDVGLKIQLEQVEKQLH